MAARRIDGLYCTTETADSQIQQIIADIDARAIKIKAEVSDVVTERIKALEEREKELLAEVVAMAKQKQEVLRNQLAEIKMGVVQPAASGYHLIRADSVIAFRVGEEDFLSKIKEFGKIGEASTYSSLSYATGPALGVLKVNNSSCLWVYACDRNGERRKEGGNAVTPVLCSPDHFEKIEVEDLKDGRYKMQIMPHTPGTFSLDIALSSEGSDEAIYGSPFQLIVNHPTEYRAIGNDDMTVDGKSRIGVPGSSHHQSNSVVGTLYHPAGLDYNTAGTHLFVVDQGNHRVQVFDVASGAPVCAYGSKGFGPRDFDTPCDIVVSQDNQLVVSDAHNNRLQVLQYDAHNRTLSHCCVVGAAGKGERQFQSPKGLTFAENGHVIICDAGNHRVQILDSLDGFKFICQFGSFGDGEGQFNSPLDAVVNSKGEIIVSDSNCRIQVFDGSGVFQRCFGYGKGKKDGFFDYPCNMAINDENAIFVCDQANHRIQILNASDGSFIHKWGGSKPKKKTGEDEPQQEEDDGTTPRAPEWIGLKKPAGIAVNMHGTVVVSDYQGSQLYTF